MHLLDKLGLLLDDFACFLIQETEEFHDRALFNSGVDVHDALPPFADDGFVLEDVHLSSKRNNVREKHPV